MCQVLGWDVGQDAGANLEHVLSVCVPGLVRCLFC